MKVIYLTNCLLPLAVNLNLDTQSRLDYNRLKPYYKMESYAIQLQKGDLYQGKAIYISLQVRYRYPFI